ncbi:MAG: hypothetical protein LUH00_00630, partial [Lachnospiraceae bacterium]|nr:hypothetical protein [Lachnospiraceae bacterium]
MKHVDGWLSESLSPAGRKVIIEQSRSQYLLSLQDRYSYSRGNPTLTVFSKIPPEKTTVNTSDRRFPHLFIIAYSPACSFFLSSQALWPTLSY